MLKYVRRWIRYLFVSIVAVECLYLISANIFLQTGLLEKILSKRPVKVIVEWSSAWSLIPGYIRLNNFQIRVQTKGVQWYGELGKAGLRLDLLALTDRTLHTHWANGEELKLRLRRNTITTTSEHDVKSGLAPIPNVSPDTPAIEFEPAKNKRPWKFKMDNLVFERIQELWIENYRLKGGGRVSGDLKFTIQGKIELKHTKLEMESTQVTFGPDIIAEDLSLDCSFGLGPYVPKLNRGRKMLPFLTGDITLAGNLTQLDFINYYFSHAPWMHLTGSARINGDVSIIRGNLQPDSLITLSSDGIHMDVYEYQIKGPGALIGSVRKNDSAITSALKIEIPEFEICREETSDQPVFGRGFIVTATSHDPQIAHGFPKLRLDLILDDLKFHDMVVLNSYLPENAGLSFLKGSEGHVHAEMVVTEEFGRGQLGFTGIGVGAEIRDKSFRADVRLNTHLNCTDPALRKFNISGTQLNISNLEFPSEQLRYSGSDLLGIRLVKAEAEFIRPINLDAQIEIDLANSHPIIALLAPERIKEKWFEDFLLFKDITGTAHLNINQETMVFNDVKITGLGNPGTLVQGTNLDIDASLKNLNLATGFKDIKLGFNLSESPMPDLSILNKYLPEAAGLVISPKSKGKIRANFKASQGGGSGEMNILADRLHVIFQEFPITGGLNLNVHMTSADLVSRRFYISGTDILLNNVMVGTDTESTTQPWWAWCELTNGVVQLHRPLSVKANLILKMANSRPFVTICATKNRWVDWFEKTLEIENIRGEGLLSMDENALILDDIFLQGDDLLIKARIKIIEDTLEGILYVKYHLLSFGVEISNGSTDYKLFRPKKWFDKQPKYTR